MGAITPIRGRARKKLRAQSAELYKQNWSARKIGAKLGHSHSTILTILREAGVTIRPKGGISNEGGILVQRKSDEKKKKKSTSQ